MQSLPLHAVLAALTLPALSSMAAAQGMPCPEEPTLAHWSTSGSVTCPCFVQNEEAGAVFTAPANHYPIEILRVGFGWGSQFGGASQTVEDSIKIYPGGLPNPGAAQFTAFAPQMTDGFINEFDFEPLSGNKVINSGPFTVALKFFNTNAGQFSAPSMINDGNGCQPGKNVVFAIPGGWSDACALGVSGDWQVQVVYRRVDCGSNSTYCMTSMNSQGPGALIGFNGSTSVAANDLIVFATGAVPSQFGIVYYGASQISVPFGDGIRCVGAGGVGTFRLAPFTADIFGNAIQPIDYTMAPMASGAGLISSGITRNFQYWYRDPMGPGGSGFNLSDGLSLTFVP